MEKNKVLYLSDYQADLEAFKKQVHSDSYAELESELLDFFKVAGLMLVPKAIYREIAIQSAGNGRVTADDVTFTGKMPALKLIPGDTVYVFAVTCGNELEGFQMQGIDPFMMPLWVEGLKTLALTAARDALMTEIKGKRDDDLGLFTLNPGSGNADLWPITQQKVLFSLLGDTEKEIGLTLTDSCLMIPNKSVSGIYFFSETHYTNCAYCERKNCPNRKEPFHSDM